MHLILIYSTHGVQTLLYTHGHAATIHLFFVQVTPQRLEGLRATIYAFKDIGGFYSICLCVYKQYNCV